MVRLSQEQYDEIMQRRGKTPAAPIKKKRSKYGAEKTWVDGICFDSKLEAKFYLKLKQLLAVGEIAGFARQNRFMLTEGTDKDNRATEYVADFLILYNDGTFEIVDTKGFETKDFILKKKIFKNKYPNLELKIQK